MYRLVMIAAIIAAALAGLGSHQTRADATAPLCYDYLSGSFYPATQWLDRPGTLVGTDGPDVLVGSAGSDVIKGLGGDDLICAFPNVIGLQADGAPAPDRVFGGGGNDRIFGAGSVDDGTGDDVLSPFSTGSKALGGTGDDEIYPVSGASADGGRGNDAIYANGPAGTLLGGPGNDLVLAAEEVVKIDCGSGDDAYDAPAGTRVRRCERVAEE